MSKSDYTFVISEVKGQPCIVIKDLNKGRKSVTNDIENVVEEIAQQKGLNPVEHIIVYRDSDGNWDGFNFSTRQFIPLQKTEWLAAVHQYIDQQ